ncbi:MAG: SOS response-associated peptidase [Bacteroidota bacterium]|jgi:putative SOS response-associated peptidase YedK
MCGRFSLTQTEAEIEERFGAKFYSNDLIKRYNVAPGQLALVLPADSPTELKLYKWGLIPSWSKDPAMGHKMINARSETLHEKPSFKNLLKHKRCLVLADGFYEWRTLSNRKKQPFRIKLKDDSLFAMAGLWDEWIDPTAGETVRTFTIITVPANPLVQELHDRMPAILNPEDEKKWIQHQIDYTEITEILTPFPENKMVYHEVTDKLNNTANDSGDLINPIQTTLF